MRAGIEPIPNSEAEYMRLPRTFSPSTVALLVVGLLSACAVQNECYNLAFKNFSSYEFSPEEYYVLGLSVNFSPTPTFKEGDYDRVQAAHDTFTRSLYLTDYHYDRDSNRPASEQPPARFRIPSPGFHPLDRVNDKYNPYTPAPGLKEYAARSAGAVRQAVTTAVERLPKIPNLSWRHRKALVDLRHNHDLVIAFADKNLGLVADDAANYLRNGIACLGNTHRTLPTTAFTASNLILTTMSAMRDRLSPLLHLLPQWGKLWMTAVLSTAAHPRSMKKFKVPAFRLLYKIHKSVLGFRPITGNHCWATQPVAELIAFLLLPFVRETPTYCKDTDDFQRQLSTVRVYGNWYLITYDVVNLYPSIPHQGCRDKIAAFLQRAGCKCVAFIVTAVELILELNYCMFNAIIYMQLIGYATGVACGGECAHLYLEESLADVFARYSQYIVFHRRYIDDGFIIFSGSFEQFTALRAELTAIDPINLQFTWETSLSHTVFLDVIVSKTGDWQNTCYLNFCCFQEAVNRYLYLPFSTATPRHVLSGFIKGELIRYIKRSSQQIDFFKMKTIFWLRLRARGYSVAFLRLAFAAAPCYAERDRLLSIRVDKEETKAHIMILDFCAQLQSANLIKHLYEFRYLLPQHLQTNFVIAWRVPPKLAALLVPFNFAIP